MRVRRNRLTRYVLRRDLLRKIRSRARQAHHRATRSELADLRRLFTHRAPDVAFDVGANIGYWTADLLRAFPAARIHAFEPTPETAEALRSHLGARPGVDIHEVAVTDQAGPIDLRVDNEVLGGGANSLLDHGATSAIDAPSADYRPVTVTGITLDDFCDRHDVDHVDVLKLDVEGAEGLALVGGRGLLERSAIDVIVSEVRATVDFTGQPRFHELSAQLAAHDYQLYSVHEFAESAIGQARWGNALYLGPAFRAELEAAHGAHACGW